MQLHWHRRTLQARPNPALSTAFTAAKRADSCVVSVFVLDDAILSRADRLGVAFMLGSLRELRSWYRGHENDLVIQQGDPTDILGRIVRRAGIQRVVWNEDHSRLARQRDRAVQRALTRSGIDYKTVPTEQPAEANASSTLPSNPAAYLANPHELPIATRTVPQLSELREDDYDSAPLTAGTDAAEKRLRALSNGTTYRRCDDAEWDTTQQQITLDRVRLI